MIFVFVFILCRPIIVVLEFHHHREDVGNCQSIKSQLRVIRKGRGLMERGGAKKRLIKCLLIAVSLEFRHHREIVWNWNSPVNQIFNGNWSYTFQGRHCKVIILFNTDIFIYTSSQYPMNSRPMTFNMTTIPEPKFRFGYPKCYIMGRIERWLNS